MEAYAFGEFYDDTGNNDAFSQQAKKIILSTTTKMAKELPNKIFDVVRNFSSGQAMLGWNNNNKSN